MTSGLQIATAIALIIIMLGMGLSLVPADFKKARSPKAISLGLLNQIILLPLIAFLLLMVFSVSPEVAIGIMIIAACPGGATSNLVTNLAKGDTALSIYLTVFSSVITILTIPFVVNFALDYFSIANEHAIRLDPVETIIKISLSIIFPVIIGMLIRHYFPNFSSKMNKPVKIASVLFIVFIILGTLYDKHSLIVSSIVESGPIVLSLNILVMIVAYYSVSLSLGRGREALTIVIESGIQNGILAIWIANNLLNNTAYSITPMVYSLVMFMTVFAYITFLKRRLGVVA